jgi:putative ABC transport system substrate-binding protein
MRRREFIKFAGAAAAWPLAALAQTDRPSFLRVGTASPQSRMASTSILVPFEKRLAELGYVDGKNFALEFISISRPDQFGQAFRELVHRKVDVLLAFGAEASLKSAMAATDKTPIVMVAIDYDPFRAGYVHSLARPPGNVTGLFLEQIELAAKRIQVLKDVFPPMTTATVFWDELSTDQWKGDISCGASDARSTPGSRHLHRTIPCPLWTITGSRPPYPYHVRFGLLKAGISSLPGLALVSLHSMIPAFLNPP